MPAYVDQTDLESRFGAENVASAFSVIDETGACTGEVDQTRLASAIVMGCDELDSLLVGASPAEWRPPYPTTLKRLAGILVMHEGYFGKREYQADPTKNPFFQRWGQARADLEKIAKGQGQRVTPEAIPSVQRVSVINHNPESSKPGFFIPRPDGSGGLSGY